MKRILTIFISIMIIGISNTYAQISYLVDTHTPVDSYGYSAYKSSASKQIAMSGGLTWRGGFTLSNSSGPFRAGYATFDLGGKYDKLLFVLGIENHGRGAGGSGIDTDVRVITVHADGRKILDTKVYPYGVPIRIELDVNGVSELKFSNVVGGNIAVGEATLWRAEQSPIETGNLITTQPKTIELAKDLHPYFKNNYIIPISPSSKDKSFKINGQEYNYGFVANMTMPLAGECNAWAYFNLRRQYSKLSFVVGPVDNKNKAGSGWFSVKADGKTIYEIETKYDAIAQVVTLDVEGCEMLSFHTVQESGTSFWGVGKIMAYPAGVQADAATASTIDSRLKELPDVCKLISNIHPYSIVSGVEKQIYDGTSDYITFSMGGEKFSEGIVFYKTASLMDSNISAHAIFDLGNEFDYISFTAGYIGKSGSMTNDRIRLYADDELVFETRLIATYPNQKFVVPINKCRKLRFENKGSGKLDVGAFGVGDLIVYRGEVVENDLFPRPIPDCPDEIDLIDLGAPYIHYVSPMKSSSDKIFYDGSTIREYFDLNGERIYKGFMLQTSVHFSLDFGIFYSGDDSEDEGSQGAAAAVVGGAAVGSAFVAGGAAVGGAVVGSTLIGAAALLMLAAGGTALESSCAAFNTYEQYNSVTFTVACCGYRNSNIPSTYKETLLIGADQKEVANIAIYETMDPQTITVPIDGCGQLLFFLANTGKWSGQYIIYDIKLSKQSSELFLPKDVIPAQVVISNPKWSEKELSIQWERPSKSGQTTVDNYLLGVSNSYSRTLELIKSLEPDYEIQTYYLETSAGQVCKAVNLKTLNSDNIPSITYNLKYRLAELEKLQELKSALTDLSISQASTMVSLPELGLRAISYGKIVKAGSKVVSVCRKLVDVMIDEKCVEAAFLEQLINNAIDIDGKQSSEKMIFSPLWVGETPPSDMLQLVENFDAK
ncbi:MAG: NPCBM/NEW2 domain-containing protein [Rikenellaceae bacterium]